MFSVPVEEGSGRQPLASALLAVERWRIQVTRPKSLLRAALGGIGQVDNTFPIVMTDENCVNVVPKGCDIYSRLVKGVLPPTPTEATTPHSGEDSPVSLGEEAHPLGGKRGDRSVQQLAILLSGCFIGGTSSHSNAGSGLLRGLHSLHIDLSLATSMA